MNSIQYNKTLNQQPKSSWKTAKFAAWTTLAVNKKELNKSTNF